MSKEVADLDELLEGQASAMLGSGEPDASDDWIIDLPAGTASSSVQGSDYQGAATSNEQILTDLPTRSLDPRLGGDPLSHTPVFRPGRLLIPRTVARYPDFLSQLPPKAVADSLLEGYIQGCVSPTDRATRDRS